MDRIELRSIEARALIPILEELEQFMSVEAINKILQKSNKREAYIRGKELSGIKHGDIIYRLLKDVKTWGDGGDMHIDFIEITPDSLSFNVKRCPYHKLYWKLGMERYGYAFSCCRDEAFARGLSEKLKLSRTQTLMEGAAVCDFRYRLEES